MNNFHRISRPLRVAYFRGRIKPNLISERLDWFFPLLAIQNFSKIFGFKKFFRKNISFFKKNDHIYDQIIEKQKEKEKEKKEAKGKMKKMKDKKDKDEQKKKSY